MSRPLDGYNGVQSVAPVQSLIPKKDAAKTGLAKEWAILAVTYWAVSEGGSLYLIGVIPLFRT